MTRIEDSLGEMNILLKLGTKPTKRRPYGLNPKYKFHVKKELDKMLSPGIIVPMEKLYWIQHMVIQGKKFVEVGICMVLQSLNATCLHNLFLTPFTNEVLKNIRGGEVYSFTDGFLGYH